MKKLFAATALLSMSLDSFGIDNSTPVYLEATQAGVETPTRIILDSDQDGVALEFDQCLSTPYGAIVDESGCQVCPEASSSDEHGCFIIDQKEIVVPLNVKFSTGSSEITPTYYQELTRVARQLEGLTSSEIVIEGHTDNIGSDADNLDLSNARAQSVANALVSLGISLDSINLKVIGYGESQPIESNDTEEGRQYNRRVQAVVVFNSTEKRYMELSGDLL